VNLKMEAVSSLDREGFMSMAERHFRELNPAFEPDADWKESYFENVLRNQRLFLRWIRRQGVARMCAAAAIGELQTHRPSKVQLEIVTGNTAAEGLWKSLGFEKASERWILKTP